MCPYLVQPAADDAAGSLRYAQRRQQRVPDEDGLVLHKYHLQKLLQGAAGWFGFKPKYFTSHSLRAGGASAIYHNGFTMEEIQRRGRWVSDVWKIYIQGNSADAALMTKRMSENSTPSMVLHERLKASWA